MLKYTFKSVYDNKIIVSSREVDPQGHREYVLSLVFGGDSIDKSVILDQDTARKIAAALTHMTKENVR